MSETGERLIPNLVYSDADAAINWLGKAFSFDRHLRVEGVGGKVEHAQLVNGRHMICCRASARTSSADILTSRHWRVFQRKVSI